MRPLKLTMQAIGPFKAKTAVDFERIGEKDLFLIHGATGRGKTFVFDAICYALYGGTPSGREKNLASDFAEKGEMPFVEFEFMLGNERLRVRRELAYERPRQRGDGTTLTKESEVIALLRADGESETIATRKRKVNEAVQERLGLDMAQFAQVVLLPQGEFRKLLLADSGDREGLLERLFDASFYENVQGWVAEQAQVEKEANRELERNRAQRLAQAREKIPAELRPAEDAVFGVEAIREVIKRQSAEAQERKATVSVAQKQAEKAFQLVEQGKQLNRDIDALADAKHKKKVLDDRKEEIQQLELELKQAREAGKIIPQLEHLQKRTDEVAELAGKSKRAAERHEAARKEMEKAEKAFVKVPEYEAEIKRLRGLEKELDKLLETVNQLGDAYEAQERREERLGASTQSATDAAGQVDALEKTLAALHEDIEALKKAEVDSTALRQTLAVVQDLRQRTEDLLRLEQQIRTRKSEAAAAEQERDAAKKSLVDLREKRERNLAGELARTLEEGTPCPVCGSRDHPMPASLVDDEATLDAVEAAESVLQEKETALNTAVELAGKLEFKAAAGREEAGKLREKLGGDPDDEKEDALRAAIQQEEARRQKLSGQEGRLKQIAEKELPEFRTAKSEADTKATEAKADVKNGTKEIGRLEKRFADQMSAELSEFFEADEVSGADVDEVRGGVLAQIEALGDRIGQAREGKEAATGEERESNASLAEIRDQLKAAENELRDAESKTDKAIRESLFGSGEAVLSAGRNRRWMEKTDAELKGYSADCTAVAERVRDLETRTGGRDRAELDTLEADHREKKVALDAVQKMLSELEHCIQELTAHADAIAAFEQKYEAVAKRLEFLGRIDEQLRGQSQPRISLKRFFLAQRLDEVLIQATRRLQVLSNGRFELKRTDNAGHAGRQAGLDLCVVDNHTGTERPVNTLSGGQLFLASLSMALGLADVVQARSGGIRLDTLFIDEGFGALDDETLQVALKVLNELRDGRMVGVISHVGELRRQIEKRIEVVAADDVGSKIQMHV